LGNEITGKKVSPNSTLALTLNVAVVYLSQQLAAAVNKS
jgi:hypothetical protein